MASFVASQMPRNLPSSFHHVNQRSTLSHPQILLHPYSGQTSVESESQTSEFCHLDLHPACGSIQKPLAHLLSSPLLVPSALFLPQSCDISPRLHSPVLLLLSLVPPFPFSCYRLQLCLFLAVPVFLSSPVLTPFLSYSVEPSFHIQAS